MGETQATVEYIESEVTVMEADPGTGEDPEEPGTGEPNQGAPGTGENGEGDQTKYPMTDPK